jgi:hypothetical protein
VAYYMDSDGPTPLRLRQVFALYHPPGRMGGRVLARPPIRPANRLHCRYSCLDAFGMPAARVSLNPPRAA